MAAKRVGVLSAAAIVGLAAAVVASAQTPLAFQASENPSTVVMQLTQDVGVEGDDTPLLRIYGDGRVLVHFPVYMRRAGDYGLRLDSTELDGLLQTFVQGGLVDFTVERVREEIRQVRGARRRDALETGGPLALTTRSDDVVVSIDVRLERYTDADGAVRQNVETRASWSDCSSTWLTSPRFYRTSGSRARGALNDALSTALPRRHQSRRSAGAGRHPRP